jgi:hypothetical protein
LAQGRDECLQGKGIGMREAHRLEQLGYSVDPTATVARKRQKWDSAVGNSNENTPLHLFEPKDDLHGIGYDRFRNAEAFRQAWKLRQQAAADDSAPTGLCPPAVPCHCD